MKMNGNTILITGGSNGIGFALAQRFVSLGNRVIICGRDAHRLSAAAAALGADFIQCDVAQEAERTALYEQAVERFPELNVLINNAGIQRRMDLMDAEIGWPEIREELAINLEAPIHLSRLFTAHLLKQPNPAILNVSSELAFLPPIWVPVYGATKAGAHSFTFSLRKQLEHTGLNVIEVIPPAVNTDLGGPGLHTFGVDVNLFADAVIEGLNQGALEIGYNNLDATRLPRTEIEKNAVALWQRRKKV